MKSMVVCIGLVYVLVGCTNTAADKCKIVTDDGIVAGINKTLNESLEKLESHNSNSHARSMFWKDFEITYLDCGETYHADAHFDPSMEAGVEKFGNDILFEIGKDDFNIRAIYLGQQKTKLR